MDALDGNVLAILMVSILLLLTSILSPVFAAEVSANTTSEVMMWKFLSMALAIGMCSLGAAYAVAQVSVAALASAAEKPEIFGRSLIFAGLAEGIAIYGLLIAFIIWITT